MWLVAFAVASSGCHNRVYDFGKMLAPIDAGTADVNSGGSFEVGAVSDAPPIVVGVDSGSAGGSDDGGQAGVTGSVKPCDDNSPDRLTDPANCGKCLNNCAVPNSTSVCVGGLCQLTCLGDFVDADKILSNGCECEPTNGGVEICDGIDNNCNGIVDEGFDLKTDVKNCGGCNKMCTFPFATASCDDGVCQQGSCLDGYYDRDPTIPGCETACAKTNGGVEICDGLDNDCDGIVDDNLQPADVTCKTIGVCARTKPSCDGPNGWVCKYPSTYQEVEDTSMGCDGLDNDCNGQVDEAFEIGKPCAVGTGPCAGVGVWVCDNTATGDHRCMGSMKMPGTEVCNGKDDNCNGEVDELNSQSDRTADDVIVYVPGLNVTMFAYEATRYDATATSHGFDSTRRPCSVPGRQPWTNVTKEEAEAACEKTAVGWRLCTAAEWFAACGGANGTLFPYGNSYVGADCNGYDYMFPSPAATVPTGSAVMCVSSLSPVAGNQLFDMSGNVKEWTISGAATSSGSGPYEMRGGAYDNASFIDNAVTPPVLIAPGLQCDASISAPTVAVRLPSVGFRCCRTGMLPP